MTKTTLRRLLTLSISALALTSACAEVPAGIAAELLKQLRQDAPEVRDCKPKRGLPFTAQEIFLSTEGSPQYLLTSTSDCMCGQVNCSEWVYRRGPQKWELLLETQGYLFTVRPTVHNGYRDVETQSRDNAVRVDTLRYQFDGHVYKIASAPKSEAQAAAADRTQRVRFAPGMSSIQLQGSVTPHDTQSWNVGARKAQTLRLSLVDHDNAGIGFTVLGPRGFNGRALTTSRKRWEGTLPATGTYMILVDAPREGRANYTLGVEVR